MTRRRARRERIQRNRARRRMKRLCRPWGTGLWRALGRWWLLKQLLKPEGQL